MIEQWRPNPEIAQVEREILLLVRERNIAQQELRGLCAGSDEHAAVKRTLSALEYQIGRLEFRRRSLPRQMQRRETITNDSPPPEAA